MANLTKSEIKAKREGLALKIEYAKTGHPDMVDKNPGFGNYRVNSTEEAEANCNFHGTYKQYKNKICSIVDCKDVGSECLECLIEEDRQLSEDATHLEIEKLLNRSGIGLRFRKCHFTNFEVIGCWAYENLTRCQQYAESWLDEFDSGNGIIMCGISNSGKTHLAAALAKEIIINFQASILLTNETEIARKIKGVNNIHSNRTEDDIYETYCRNDLLIIDDVGCQDESLGGAPVVREIINMRYDRVLPTIIITNLMHKELCNHLGQRAVSRIVNSDDEILIFAGAFNRGNHESLQNMSCSSSTNDK